MVFFKHKYISNPTVTAADAVTHAAQNIADALKTKRNSHLGDESLMDLYNLQKIFAHAAANKKIAKDTAQHTPTTKMTHLPTPALNTAPEKLSVATPIRPPPLHDTATPSRVAFWTPPRVDTHLDLSPPTP